MSNFPRHQCDFLIHFFVVISSHYEGKKGQLSCADGSSPQVCVAWYQSLVFQV